MSSTRGTDGRKRRRDETEEQSTPVLSKKPKDGPEGTPSGSEVVAPNATCPLELLSYASEAHLYSIGLIFRDDKLTLWYQDASGLVKTTGVVSIITDFEEFTIALIALAYCDASRWGVSPVFRLPEKTSYSQVLRPLNSARYIVNLRYPGDENKVKIILHKRVCSRDYLVGRRTFVYEATSRHNILKDEVFVVKFSQQVKTRRSEQDLLKTAVAAGVKNVPKLYFADDIWSLSDGPRNIFHPDHVPYDDRVFRAIAFQKYVPLQVVLREHPEYLEIMITQLLRCGFILRIVPNYILRRSSRPPRSPLQGENTAPRCQRRQHYV